MTPPRREALWHSSTPRPPAACAMASPVGPYRDLGAHMGMEKESSLVHGDVGVENKIGGRGEVNVSRSKSN